MKNPLRVQFTGVRFSCDKAPQKGPVGGKLQDYPLNFVDLFAGCGGLSLGLMQAGWNGLFAVEQSSDAFDTLHHNLVNGNRSNPLLKNFEWPEWMEKEPCEASTFLETYREHLPNLVGRVTLVAGGPPCQGFSFAGRRQAKDPRNELFLKYLEIVKILNPALIMIENVQGISVAHGKKKWVKDGRRGRPLKSYSEKIKRELEACKYVVQQGTVNASEFGVPQTRLRYLTVGIKEELLSKEKDCPDFFVIIDSLRKDFLESHGLPVNQPVTAAQAISDMETAGKNLIPCDDPVSPPGFFQLGSIQPATFYQKLMHGSLNGAPINSLRLPNHRPATVDKFKKILETCRKGVQLSITDRERLGIKKSAIVPLSPDKPSTTLTTLPDDLLHYKEPRIHTVREHARLQSFPDWFEFKGRYTTGGDRRKKECPRYTQVGNAVPPLLAEAIGHALIEMLRSC